MYTSNNVMKLQIFKYKHDIIKLKIKFFIVLLITD